MTGTIVTSPFVHLAIAGMGARLAHGGWRLLLGRDGRPGLRHRDDHNASWEG